MKELKLFALNSSRELGESIAGHLGIRLSAQEEREFEDGEHKTRPLETVRGQDVYIISSLNGDTDQSVNDRLCRLLFFVGALKDMGAGRLTAVCPYLGYSRKDRRTKLRDPVTTRYVAQLLESVGIDAIVTIDVHNPAAFQNAFRKPTIHLEAAPLFASYLLPRMGTGEPALMSPDTGGFKRAERLREFLMDAFESDVPLIFMEKKRSEGEVTGQAIVGEVKGKSVLIIDDMIGTGTTLSRAIQACQELGCASAIAFATHGLFTDGAKQLTGSGLERMVICNTVSPVRLPSDSSRLEILDIAPLFADSIIKLHRGLPVEPQIPTSVSILNPELFASS